MAKLLLEAFNLTKSYGTRRLLHLDTLRVYDGERIGLIGENGAGKSTLLAILSGELAPDGGTVRRLAPLACIHQQGLAECPADRQLSSLYQVPQIHDGLSGGELTRGRIAAALASQPQLLLADEPTTDLDEQGQALLCRQLSAHNGALLLVSHDRALLRLLCTRIWHLEDGTVIDFPGGYDAFQQEQKRMRDRAQFEYEQYRDEQARLKAAAQKMSERASSVRKAPSRMGNSEARLHRREASDAVLRLSHAKRSLQNRMEQMEAKERPRPMPDIRMQMGISHPVEAKTALRVEHLNLIAGSRCLLSNASFTVPTGSRTALLGPNGCGKTTLLCALTGQLDVEGSIRLNPEVRLGWFDQHHTRTLKDDKSLLENILAYSSLPEHAARTVLSRLGFSREDAFKQTGLLSGGEKAKAALARLLLMDCNFLVLDEPTNHLDIFAMEALEELLDQYAGTLLFVSHDESFVRHLATRLIRFERGKLITYEESLTAQETRAKQRNGEQARLRLASLQMRQAELAARMSKPKKGDKPSELQSEYQRIADEIRSLRQD